jgi:hypothetical protein
MITDFEFRQGERSWAGRIESPRYAFEILADAADDLQAAPDPELDRQVREALTIVEVRDKSTWGRRGWQPPIRWGGSATLEAGSLHTPIWEIQQPLPVDLCFRSLFPLEGTDEVLEGNEVVVLAGETSCFYFRLKHLHDVAILRAHADDQGFVRARVVLQPSRAIALSDPRVGRYYGGKITSEVVRFRVDRDEIGDVFEPPRE